jgi:dTDP-4-dehydrorhamnose 3,5-epimerase
MNFNVTTNQFEGLKIIEPKIFKDSRGYFFESHKASSFKEFGVADDFIQGNQSFSNQGVIRGLHFQAGKSAQAKLVRCLSGEIYDVAVDLRKSSPTFGKYFGINLSAQNHLMVYIPVGFAHGFSTLSQTAEVFYNVSGSEYDPKSESGIRFDDPDLAIDWKVKNPIVSDKDKILPFLNELKNFF